MESQLMEPALPLTLDSTEELLGGTQIGPHDNSAPEPSIYELCMAELEKVGGN